MLHPLAEVARRLILRTEQGPLRHVWSAGYEGLFRGLGAYLRAGDGGGVFVGGSFGRGEPVFGVSDVDLVVVLDGDPRLPGRARARARRRWESLRRLLPPLSLLVGTVAVYETRELGEAVSSTCLTYGLDGTARDGDPRAAFLGAATPADEGGLLVRPGLWPTREWRLVSGSDRRPAKVAADPQHRRVAAWLELQFWWRFAFAACADPASPHAPFMCVKLAAEPARIWLWLARGEQVFARRDVLRRVLRLLPEEEDALRLALRLHDTLPQAPDAPLAEILPCFVRLSSRVAEQLADETADAGTTDVGLVGRGTELVVPALTPVSGPLLPLVDWRARVSPNPPDEVFTASAGDPADPAALASAVLASRAGPYVALRADGLLAFPSADASRAELRSVQCGLTDPVSFALIDGRSAAAFPNVAGWSALDSARRAVAEHRAWLAAGGAPGARGLGLLLSAARAALFLESFEAGSPELALTAAAVADLVGQRGGPAAQAVTDSAFGSYRAAQLEGAAVETRTVSALAELVSGLPAYADRGGR